MRHAVLIIGAILAINTYAGESRAQSEGEVAAICVQLCCACCCGVTPTTGVAMAKDPQKHFDAFSRGIVALYEQDDRRSVDGRRAQTEVGPVDLPPPRERQVAVARRRTPVVY